MLCTSVWCLVLKSSTWSQLSCAHIDRCPWVSSIIHPPILSGGEKRSRMEGKNRAVTGLAALGRHEGWESVPSSQYCPGQISPDGADRLMNWGHQLTLLLLSWESQWAARPSISICIQMQVDDRHQMKSTAAQIGKDLKWGVDHALK